MKILLCGALGETGRAVLSLEEENFTIVCGVDKKTEACRVPIYPSYDLVEEQVDTVIDFSSPSALSSTLAFAKKQNANAVIATTGLSEQDFSLIKRHAETLPVFYSTNFSPTVYLLRKIAQSVQKYMTNAEVYIVEKHRFGKKDAPSGTAKTLQEALSLPSTSVLSLRGGICPGEHEIVFLGQGETLTLSHRAESRTLFARGAIEAAKFLQGKKNGLFGMEDFFA